MSDESVEYKTMESIRDALKYVCKTASITLCKEFHKEKLISYDLLVMCKENLDDNEDFAGKVAEQLQERVKVDPAAFCCIQEVLRRTTGVDFMAEQMEKELEEKKKELEEKKKELQNEQKRSTPTSSSQRKPKKASKSTSPKTSRARTAAASTSQLPKSTGGSQIKSTGGSLKTKGAAKPPESDEDDVTEDQPSKSPVQAPAMAGGSIQIAKEIPSKPDTNGFIPRLESHEDQNIDKSTKDEHSRDSKHFINTLNWQELAYCSKCESRNYEMAKLKEQHAEEQRKKSKKMEEMKSEYEGDIEKLERKVKKSKDEHEEETEQMRIDHKSRMQQMRDDHKRRMQQMRDDHDEEIEGLQNKIRQLKERADDIKKII